MFGEDLGKAIHLGLITANDNRSTTLQLPVPGFRSDGSCVCRNPRRDRADEELSSFTDTSSMTTERSRRRHRSTRAL